LELERGEPNQVKWGTEKKKKTEWSEVKGRQAYEKGAANS